MTKITNIDRGTLRMIEQRVNAALKDLGDELGIDARKLVTIANTLCKSRQKWTAATA